jgi:hypothetical protein
VPFQQRQVPGGAAFALQVQVALNEGDRQPVTAASHPRVAAALRSTSVWL